MSSPSAPPAPLLAPASVPALTVERLSWVRAVGLACVALAVALFFFSPSLWMMHRPAPGSFEWTRALGYLHQCAEPFARDVEPALRWRLLPPLAAHALGLRGYAPLLIPWLGIVAFVAYATRLFYQRLPSRRWALAGATLVAGTSGVLVPLHWLGINDAWVWLGLLAVAFGPGRLALPVACLLCPWIDERFIIGFPLAWLCARLERDEPVFSPALLQGLWLLPYVVARLALTWRFPAEAAASGSFIRDGALTALKLLPLVPLAWWMGLRAAWLPVLAVFDRLAAPRALLLAGVLLATLAPTVVLASDLSRSVAILLPVVLLGCFRHLRLHPAAAPRRLVLAACAGLLLPALHVVHTKLSPISTLPVELVRLIRAQP